MPLPRIVPRAGESDELAMATSGAPPSAECRVIVGRSSRTVELRIACVCRICVAGPIGLV
jgi:hypothetical protein